MRAMLQAMESHCDHLKAELAESRRKCQLIQFALEKECQKNGGHAWTGTETAPDWASGISPSYRCVKCGAFGRTETEWATGYGGWGSAERQLPETKVVSVVCCDAEISFQQVIEGLGVDAAELKDAIAAQLARNKEFLMVLGKRKREQ